MEIHHCERKTVPPENIPNPLTALTRLLHLVYASGERAELVYDRGAFELCVLIGNRVDPTFRLNTLCTETHEDFILTFLTACRAAGKDPSMDMVRAHLPSPLKHQWNEEDVLRLIHLAPTSHRTPQEGRKTIPPVPRRMYDEATWLDPSDLKEEPSTTATTRPMDDEQRRFLATVDLGWDPPPRSIAPGPLPVDTGWDTAVEMSQDTSAEPARAQTNDIMTDDLDNGWGDTTVAA